jgi:anti-sigma factor RsiW
MTAPADPPAFRRIDPMAVPAMFRRRGLTPGRHAFRDGCRACVLGALLADAGATIPVPEAEIADAAAALGLSYAYAIGLAIGWDGDRYRFGPRGTEAGVNDGRAAALMCGLDLDLSAEVAR